MRRLACATCTSNDEPPTMVESVKAEAMPQILAQRHRRRARLRGGAEHAVDVFEPQAAVGERAMDALRHQVERTHVGGDRADVGFGGADDRGAAAREAVHGAPSTGVNTG